MPANVIETKKHAMRQTQEGSWLVTLSLHQADVPHWLFTAPVGQRMALAELTILADEESPRSAQGSSPAPAEANGESRATPVVAGGVATKRKPLSPGSRAALMCKDPRAWPVITTAAKRWRPGATVEVQDEPAAAAWLREICDVDSRRDLTDDNRVWGTVSAEYERAIGKIGP